MIKSHSTYTPFPLNLLVPLFLYKHLVPLPPLPLFTLLYLLLSSHHSFISLPHKILPSSMASLRLMDALLLIICLALSFDFSYAMIKTRPLRHYVNGRQGWVPHPAQDYNKWAGSNRFLVHDTLYFRYNKDQDSVLEVSKEDYDSCNTDHPIQKKQDGDSEFDLTHPGPFYFISGNKTHCEQGQKIIVSVLHYPSSLPSPPVSQPPALSPGGHHHHPHPHPHPHPPSGAPTPKSSPGPTSSLSPASSPGSHHPYPHPQPPTASSPGPTSFPITPSTSPATSPSGATSPATSPSGATSPATSPSSTSPATSPSASTSPATSPSGATSPAISPSGATSPSTSPTAGGAPVISPTGASPPAPPAETPAGGPGAAKTPAGGPGAAETPSSDITAPAPAGTSKNGAERSGKGSSMVVGILSLVVALVMWST